MNRDRIQLAIDILRNVPDERFNMVYWAKFKHAHKEDETPALVDTCGSAGCALGWIASDQRARALGLTLAVDSLYNSNSKYSVPMYRKTRGEHAGAAFFDFGEDTAAYLFDPNEYDTPQDKTLGKVRPQNVIDRFELLLAVGEKRFLEIMEGDYAPGRRGANESDYRFMYF